MIYRLTVKPALDFSISLLLLVVLFPVWVIVLLLLLLFQKGNPFFVQIRPGLNEEPFKLIKFRTMSTEVDSNGNLLPDHQRMTGIGRVFRKTSLDEIPQLINVLKGDMSFVGPRPLFMKYLPYYWFEERQRHSVRPGITGLAQISGRNRLCWDERLALDVDYVKNYSFLLDAKIILKTLVNVVIRKDVNIDPSSTMKDLDVERSELSQIEKYRWFLTKSITAQKGVDFGIVNLGAWVDKVLSNGKVIVVNRNTDIVSYVAFYENNERYFITMVWTSYLYRSKGYAQYLISEILSKRKNKPVDLVVNKDNGALLLYKKIGFKEVDSSDNKLTLRYD